MNVRLPPELRARLDRVASKSTLKAADLIRLAVEEYCDVIEKTGRITIPFLNDESSTEEELSDVQTPTEKVIYPSKTTAKKKKS